MTKKAEGVLTLEPSKIETVDFILFCSVTHNVCLQKALPKAIEHPHKIYILIEMDWFYVGVL